MAITESRPTEQMTTEETFSVRNPATGQNLANVPNLDEDAVAALVARARAAQPAWAALSFKERGNLMRDLRAWIVKERKRLAEAIIQETGKTYEDALIEVLYMCEALGFWAKKSKGYLKDEKLPARSALMFGKSVIVRHQAVGVVGVIAPWNYPIVLGVGDVIPALMAGNGVVLKPSEVTPLSSELIVEEAMPALGFPKDICLLATGEGKTGAALVDHADMIMFTGSTATGKKIAAQAAERLIPVSLELGGKDPMIVLEDADLDRAVNTAIFSGLGNAGQTCMAAERLYVEAPVYDEFVQRLSDRVSSLKVSEPGGSGPFDMGSMTAPGQIDIVERHVKDAVEKGARVLTGGKRRDGAGDYYEPTVLVDVDHTMACMTEETFGPTLPVVKVKDADEALALSNDSTYGLNSSVFTKNLKRGEEIARKIEAGNSCVNDALTNYFDLRAPFGGWKTSGVGGRHGVEGIRKYTKAQTISITKLPMPKAFDPFVYPRTKKNAKIMEAMIVALYRRGS